MRTFDAFSRRFLLTFPVLAAAQSAVPPLRGLSRTNLFEYHDAGGNVVRGRGRQAWERRRAEAIAGFHAVAGPLPGAAKRIPLDLRVESETDMGRYLRRAITYASEPGSRTTAYLCVPKTATAARPAPGVLCLHPTDNQTGYGVVVGLGGRPHRQYASELAERGYVTLSTSYVQLAGYQPDLEELGYVSGTMKAIWDNIRGLDLLDAMPEVRHPGYAAIGHSLGGHNAIYTAALEPRIQVVVSSCGFDSFLDYYDGNIKGWVQPRYMMRMGQYLGRPEAIPFDFYELIAALAPRPLFVNAPLHDANFRAGSVDRVLEAARPVYALDRAENRIRVEHPNCDHDFPDDVRFAAYDWIAKWLGQPAGTKVR